MKLIIVEQLIKDKKVGALYSNKEELRQRVQDKIEEMGSEPTKQREWFRTIDKAIEEVHKELKDEGATEDEMVDFELTLSMIERTFKTIPEDVYFKSLIG